jgi:hypothetical protein
MHRASTAATVLRVFNSAKAAAATASSTANDTLSVPDHHEQQQ